MNLRDFPLTPLLPCVRASLREHPRLVLEAPPGAGKTTQVPPALLDEAWLAGRKIVMLEPRRIATGALAAAAAPPWLRTNSEAISICLRERFHTKL